MPVAGSNFTMVSGATSQGVGGFAWETTLSQHPDSWVEPLLNESTGTGADTNNPDVSAGIGVETIAGTGASTNNPDVSVGSGTVLVAVTGTGASTNASDISAGTGVETIAGTGASTNVADISAGTGVETIAGTGASTNASDISAGTGVETIAGTGASTNNPDVSVGSGTETISGSGASTNNPDVSVGSGTVLAAVTGSGASTNNPDVSAGSGFVTNPTPPTPPTPAPILGGYAGSGGSGGGGGGQLLNRRRAAIADFEDASKKAKAFGIFNAKNIAGLRKVSAEDVAKFERAATTLPETIQSEHYDIVSGTDPLPVEPSPSESTPLSTLAKTLLIGGAAAVGVVAVLNALSNEEEDEDLRENPSSRRRTRNLPSATPRGATYRCLVCRKEKSLSVFSVEPGRPRSRICNTCRNNDRGRLFDRQCVDCGRSFKSFSNRAGVCESCKPARDAAFATARKRKQRGQPAPEVLPNPTSPPKDPPKGT